MNDPIKEHIHFPLPIASPCCGPGMLAWGTFYGAKVYVCRNCLNFVERKDALPLIRKARRAFKEIYHDVMFREIPADGPRLGDTVNWIKPPARKSE